MRGYAHRRWGFVLSLAFLGAYMAQGTLAFDGSDLARGVTADVVTDPSGYYETPADYTCFVPDLSGITCRDVLTNQGPTPVMVNITSSETGNAGKCELVDPPVTGPNAAWIPPGGNFHVNITAAPDIANGETCTVTVTLEATKDFVFHATTGYDVLFSWFVP